MTLIYDGHGSTRELLRTLNGAVTVLQRYAYQAYGMMLGGQGLTTLASALTSLLYSGEMIDKLTGLQNLRDRLYDVNTGRFTQFDRYAGRSSDPASLHRYLYTAGNPINGVDPNGFSLLTDVLVAAGIGLLAFSLLGGATFAVYNGINSPPVASPSSIPAADKEFARIAADSYKVPASGFGSWHAVSSTELPSGLKSSDFTTSLTGFHAQLYINSDSIHYALAYAGTDQGRDWWANIGQGATGPILTTQYHDAVDLAEKVIAATRKPVTMVGHSLGGGLATAAAMDTNMPAITFNAAGLNYLSRMWYGTFSYHQPVVAYRVEGEVLTFLQESFITNAIMPDAYGTQFHNLKPAPWDASADKVTLHLMPAVLAAMQA